ncbi:MAG TPA: ATP-binding protein [Spirochaetota bacterium]|nr:ATP-binding protein [Spirochaetota bacterium]HNT12910.1 ATP-binding protein [Spirochaetota bacterium]HOS39298.1 ATP-binding protein [Spirochaetota bacterium]
MLKRAPNFSSVRVAALFWVCGLALSLLAVFGLSMYLVRMSDIRAAETERLEAQRDARARAIGQWLDRIAGDLRTLAAMPEVRSNAALMGSGALSGHQASAPFRGVFNAYLHNYNLYYEFFIISARLGKIVYSTTRENIGEARPAESYFSDAIRDNDILVKDIYFSKNLSIPTMTVAVPLHASPQGDAPLTGYLVARIYLDRSLYELLGERGGLGSSGEALLVNGRHKLMNRVRGLEGAPLSQRLDDPASRLAAEGKTGAMEVTDFRGRTALAAYTHLPRLRWGLVVKKDAEEVYAPARRMLGEMALAFVVALALLAYVGVRLGSGLAAPLEALSSVMRRIGGGEYAVRASIPGRDELGRLAESFNAMADSITAELQLQKESSDIIEIMVSAVELHDFSTGVLRALVEMTASSIGAFYVLSPDGREFVHLTSIGLDANAMETFHAEKLEGEFGRALATRRITRTRNISGTSMLRLRTVIGDVVPTELVTVPVVVNNRCVAIISLASLGEYSEMAIKVLNLVWPVMNTSFSNIIANEETRVLARELRSKNQLLEMQKEELQAKAEELRRQTERVNQQNAELEEQRARVEEANRLKSEFLSNMSHELRTPLNAILSLSKVLIRQAAERLPADEVGYLEIIERNGRTLLALINDILDLSKIEAGRIDLKPQRLSLPAVVGAIIENLERSAQEKGIALEARFAAGFPEIESDEQRVYQIVQNIIGNAVKFTERGGVTVAGRFDAHTVTIEVADTGIGIAENDIPTIFEEFRQIDGTLSRKYGGTGLGLAIASKSARLIGGAIDVASTPGTGSTFTVRMPIAWGGACVPAPQRARPADNRANDGSGRPLILVIEDDPDNLTTIKALLAGHGTVIEATTGRAGLERVRAERPDLVLLDMALPEMNGFEVARAIKDDPDTAALPVIAVTALTMDGDRERALAAGCDDYLPKPIDIDALFVTIRRWVRLA